MLEAVIDTGIVVLQFDSEAKLIAPIAHPSNEQFVRNHERCLCVEHVKLRRAIQNAIRQGLDHRNQVVFPQAVLCHPRRTMLVSIVPSTNHDSHGKSETTTTPERRSIDTSCSADVKAPENVITAPDRTLPANLRITGCTVVMVDLSRTCGT
jgi:hypothetical protein